MPKGGKRPGAGRKPGSLTKRTREIAEGASAAGELPLEYMLRQMRDPRVDPLQRSSMAVAAAPYLHPRLSATRIEGVKGDLVPIINVEIFRFTDKDGTLTSDPLRAQPRAGLVPGCPEKLR
jgi:hypothetical protein